MMLLSGGDMVFIDAIGHASMWSSLVLDAAAAADAIVSLYVLVLVLLVVLVSGVGVTLTNGKTMYTRKVRIYDNFYYTH